MATFANKTVCFDLKRTEFIFCQGTLGVYFTENLSVYLMETLMTVGYVSLCCLLHKCFTSKHVQKIRPAEIGSLGGTN